MAQAQESVCIAERGATTVHVPGNIWFGYGEMWFCYTHLNYCKPFQVGRLLKIVQNFQLVQNDTAGWLTRASYRNHTIPLLQQLHYLPLCFCTQSKMLGINKKALPSQLTLPGYWDLQGMPFSWSCCPHSTSGEDTRECLFICCSQAMKLPSIQGWVSDVLLPPCKNNGNWTTVPCDKGILVGSAQHFILECIFVCV